MPAKYGLGTEKKKSGLRWLYLPFMLLLGLGSLALATQRIAAFFSYHPALGEPWGVAWGIPWYAPWLVFAWQKRFGPSDTYGFIEQAVTHSQALFLLPQFIILGVWLGFMKKLRANANLHGSARWATEPEIRTMGYFEGKGVYVGVISAKVHMDEKTPHMHFLHVPVTPDGRLNAKEIYTRESLKKLQTELPRHLQSRGFDLQRGVEQEPGAKKKHLNTREFKQQQEALNSLEKEAQAVSAELEQRQREESALLERLHSIERQALEAEKTLSEQTDIPKASILNFKSVLETAQEIIERQKKALAANQPLNGRDDVPVILVGLLQRPLPKGVQPDFFQIGLGQRRQPVDAGAIAHVWPASASRMPCCQTGPAPRILPRQPTRFAKPSV